eukprot:1137066-Pelagomonas_calceolata.AAC.8
MGEGPDICSIILRVPKRLFDFSHRKMGELCIKQSSSNLNLTSAQDYLTQRTPHSLPKSYLRSWRARGQREARNSPLCTPVHDAHALQASRQNSSSSSSSSC